MVENGDLTMDNNELRIEVARLLRLLKEAKGWQEKSTYTAHLLAELGVIINTPGAKAQWRNQ